MNPPPRRPRGTLLRARNLKRNEKTMTTIIDDDAKAQALCNMASAAATADPTLGQAFVDAGVIQARGPGIRPKTTNRRVETAARKRVEKWMKKAVRQIEEQAATGVLDLSQPPGAIPMRGRRLSGPCVSLRSQVESLIEEDKAQLQRTGGIAPVLIAETKEGLVEFMLPFDKHERVHEAAHDHVTLMTSVDTTAYVVICDAWMSAFPTDGPVPEVRPSEDPQRKEVISAYLETKDGAEAWIVPYERTPDGIEFGEIEHSTRAGGRWSGLLAARH
jgi:hypothetical protein